MKKSEQDLRDLRDTIKKISICFVEELDEER